MNDFTCVIKKYSDYFYQASSILHGIEDTLSGLQFDEKTQAVEVFAAQSLSMSRDHCRAIGLLLNDHLFAEAIAISRSLFELSFDLVWIQSINDQSERLECVYKLEADPYFHMNKEVKLYEEDVRISSVLTSEEKLNQFKQVIEKTKQGRSYLTVSNAQGNVVFKRAPSLAKRMGHDLRLQYYSIYGFMSLFSHPSPILKELHLQNVNRKETVDQLVEKSVDQTLADVFLLVEILAKTATDLLAVYVPNKSGALKIYCEELFQLTEKIKKDYNDVAIKVDNKNSLPSDISINSSRREIVWILMSGLMTYCIVLPFIVGRNSFYYYGTCLSISLALMISTYIFLPKRLKSNIRIVISIMIPFLVSFLSVIILEPTINIILLDLSSYTGSFLATFVLSRIAINGIPTKTKNLNRKIIRTRYMFFLVFIVVLTSYTMTFQQLISLYLPPSLVWMAYDLNLIGNNSNGRTI